MFSTGMKLIVQTGLLCLLSGCGSASTTVPVSGKITLDGQPLANASVRFLPKAEGGAADAGISSAATTDADGRFVLKTTEGNVGAIPARHWVRITTLQRKEANDGTDNVIVLQEERVPAKYANQDALTFTVTTATDQANFDLKTK